MKTIFTLFSLLFILQTSHGQLFVKQDATGANDGSSWANAFTDFQDALDAAAPGAQVWIAQGKYVPQGPTPDSSHFIATHPVQLYGGFDGTETSLSQRDWNVNPTIISGDVLGNDIPGDFTFNRTDNAHHVLIINAPNPESVIDGLVFESGSSRLDTYAPTAADIPYNRWSGSALYLYRSGAMIRNCLFKNNDGTRGSGCYAFGDTLHTIALHFDNVIFRDNHGYNGAGGFFQAFQNLQFTNTQVTGNSGIQGGGLFFSGSNATVKNCVLDSNVATYGGAIMSFHTNIYVQHPEINVSNSSFTGNSASAWGGGLHVYNTYGSFSVEVDSCSFTGNSTGPTGYGGGIEIWDAQDALPMDPLSTINITNSEFIANTSVYGGGVEIETEDDSVKIVIEYVKFQANNGGRGGGLTVYSYAKSKLDFYMRNSEFTGNVATYGGGMSMEAINNTYPLNYLLEDCSFKSNIGQNGIGALNIQHYPRPDGVIGTIRRVLFEDNHGAGLGGAFTVFRGNHLIEDSYFFANSTDATLDSLYHGGGAINIVGPAEFSMERNIFEGNISLTDGAAITVNEDVNGSIENNLFHHQEGNSTIYNNSVISMMNSTMADNDNGIFLQNLSSTTIQNSIFNNNGDNLKWTGKPTVVSNGGNLSSDASMTDFLIGSGGFQDLNDTDPLLGVDYYPMAGSPAIDAGNPQGVFAPTDLGGNPRIMGGGIDIGSYESFTVATHHAFANDIRLKVSPNPVADVAQISFDKEIESLRLMTLDGVMIDVDQKSIGSKQINIHDFVPGVYVLWLKSEGAWHTARFSKM